MTFKDAIKNAGALGCIILIAFIAFSIQVHAQQAPSSSKVEAVIGTVAAVDPTRSVTVKTDAGPTVIVRTVDNTTYLRLPAGERTLTKAVAIRFAEIVVGDRVLSHGARNDDAFVAQRIIVLPATEVARKRENDLDEWKRRGVAGIVRALNPETSEITLELRGASAAGRLLLAAGKANFRRYNVASLRFEDAQPRRFADVKIGDQLRALGDKSADGNTLQAEEIVFGTFKTIGITVVSLDTQKGEITATTLDQKKPVVIALTRESTLRRISAPVANAIAQKARADSSRSQGPASPAGSAARPAPAVIDVQQMIDTLPAIQLSEIKPGEVLAVTGATDIDESRLIAIKVAAGVDLVLRALTPQAGRPQVVRLSAGLPAVFDFSVMPVN